MKLLYFVILVECCSQGTAQLQSCYDSTGCGGNQVTGVSTARNCCLGSGLSFQNGGSCRQCIVHGFRDNSVDLSVDEGSTEQRITIGLDNKGNSLLESPRILSFVFQITCLGRSSDVNIRVPDSEDFTATGCNTSIALRRTFAPPPTSQVGITFRADEKIEGNEVLKVQLTLTSPSQTDVSNAGNIFIRDTSTITVIDRTVVMIGFSQDDYEGLEDVEDMPNPRPCTVTVVLGRRSRTLEIPLPIRITPRSTIAGDSDFKNTAIETQIPEGQT